MCGAFVILACPTIHLSEPNQPQFVPYRPFFTNPHEAVAE